MNFRKYRIISLAALSILIHCSLPAAIIVEGNSNDAPYGFTQDITTRAFDIRTGTFFVGLQGGANTFAIAQAERPTLEITPEFTGLTPTDTPLNNAYIEFLDLSLSGQTPAVVLAVGSDASPFVPSVTTQVNAILASNGNNVITSAALNDASGSAVTAGIVGIVGTPDDIIVAVRDNAGGDFGTSMNSGLALIEIERAEQSNSCGVLPAQTMLNELITKDATTGFDGNKATPFNDASTFITGGPPSVPVTFATDFNDVNEIALYYDQPLDRAYAGIRIQVASGGNIGMGVVLLDIDETDDNILKTRPIVANTAAIDPNAPLTTDIITTLSAATPVNLSALMLRTLHASTGPDYLIINGGPDVSMNVANTIYAQPLVNFPSDRTIHGTFANKNSALVDGKFVTAATAAGQLAFITDPAAMVGNGPLPIASPTPTMPTNYQPSDMFVLGDTVYVSLPGSPNAMNDTGIFYSQAIFGSDGKIVGWTPWAKKASPINAFPGVELPGDIMHDGSVFLFAVDGTNATIWIVEGTTKQVVGLLHWVETSYPNSLVNKLNSQFSNSGILSVLDLDQATRGFAATGGTKYRYALFGGLNKVAFALISTAQNLTPQSPQTVTTDFSSSIGPNYFLSRLSASNVDAGCIEVLEYARRLNSEGNTNYFFAGSHMGLFVMADASGNGFNVNTLGDLTSPIPSMGVWFNAGIAGNVVDIKTTGNGNLYVVTTQWGSNPLLQSTVYSIPFQTTVAAMFAPGNIRTIAQSGTGTLSGTTEFYGIQIVSTGNPTSNPQSKEQLILATNQGLFYSNADQTGGVGTNGIIDAANQAAANWTLLPNTGTTLFNGIAGMDTPIRYTVWPFSLEDGGSKTFEEGAVDQLSVTGNPAGTGIVINNFDPIDFVSDSTELTTTNPITSFFSDGGRRFFILNEPNDSPQVNKLMVLPYDVLSWNLSAEETLTDPELDNVNHFNFVHIIGASGLVYAGTNEGVVSLE